MFAVTGIATTGASGTYVEMPMSKAIEVHEDHLSSTDSPLPITAMKGQQMSYDHLMMNLVKWIAKNHTWNPGEGV